MEFKYSFYSDGWLVLFCIYHASGMGVGECRKKSIFLHVGSHARRRIAQYECKMVHMCSVLPSPPFYPITGTITWILLQRMYISNTLLSPMP